MLQRFLRPKKRVFIEKTLILRTQPALQTEDEDGVCDLLAEPNKTKNAVYIILECRM